MLRPSPERAPAEGPLVAVFAGMHGNEPAGIRALENVFARIRAEGYAYASAGENIAWGHPTPEAVVGAWLASPGHCRNIMNADYRVVGIGYAYDPESEFGHYWTQNFAAGH